MLSIIWNSSFWVVSKGTRAKNTSSHRKYINPVELHINVNAHLLLRSTPATYMIGPQPTTHRFSGLWLHTSCYIHDRYRVHNLQVHGSTGWHLTPHEWWIFCPQPITHRSTTSSTCMIDILPTTHRSTGPHLLLHTWQIFSPQTTNHRFTSPQGHTSCYIATYMIDILSTTYRSTGPQVLKSTPPAT